MVGSAHVDENGSDWATTPLLSVRTIHERETFVGRQPTAGMSLPELPSGWRVWNEETDGRVILAYRPDVFNAETFPAACLPTIYVTNGSPRRRPGAGAAQTDSWQVKLFFEPDIEATTTRYDGREAALEGAVETAQSFVDGEIEYREAYQVPREAYFEKLDELLGQ